MLRQLRNLWKFGRLRTNDPTPRKRKPSFLAANPELEAPSLLEFVLSHYGRRGDDFFFVEIGAFDGVTADPIYDLVLANGWRGVFVEPQQEAFGKLKQNYAGRTGLQFFDVVIGPENGEITLYTRRDGMVQAASVDPQLMNKPGRRRKQLDARQVPCWTFERLLREANAPPRIDLLQIDAEGWDYEIIRSLDFAAVKPVIIRYEHMVLSQADRNACLQLLADQGYRFLLEDSDTIAYCPAAAERELVVQHRAA